MKVIHVEPLPKESEFGDCTIAQMEAGDLGITESGNYFYRTGYSAICLNNPGSSYSGSESVSKAHYRVRLLPKGTKVMLEVE